MKTQFKLLGLVAAIALAAPLATFTPLSADPAFARHGADDAAGDDRGGKRTNDGVGHASLEQGGILLLARHGADDPAGDDRGGKGGGVNDGPSHT